MTQPTPTPGDPAPTTPQPAPVIFQEPPPTPAVPPAPQPPADPTSAPDDKPLGPAGVKALQAERDARKELERKLQALAPLEKLAEMLGTGQPGTAGKSEVELLNEKFGKYEQDLAAERAARWRAEVAAEKQLTPQQAARLQGGTREELLADADQLLALFPAAPPAGPRTPAPDPSQGARGPVDIDALIREAESKGDVKSAIRLKMQRQRTQ